MTVAIRKIPGTTATTSPTPESSQAAPPASPTSRTTCAAPSRSTTSHLMLRLHWRHRPQLRFVEQDLSLKQSSGGPARSEQQHLR